MSTTPQPPPAIPAPAGHHPPSQRLRVVAGDDLLARNVPTNVTMLNLRLKDGSAPTDNVTQLVAAGHRVLIVSTHTDPAPVLATTTAGADGYLTKDHDMPTLVAALHQVAGGGTAYSPELAFCWARDTRPARPKLSDQERAVLVAYASGATLGKAAHLAGIRPGTARQYLDRVKTKYRQAGRPAPNSNSPAGSAKTASATPAAPHPPNRTNRPTTTTAKHPA